MNLLDDEKWLPVHRRGGTKTWIAPHQISDPDVLGLDANRADFNGSLVQFLIGLLQTMTPVDSETEWAEFFRSPPASEVLKAWFAPVREAFELDGDGPRFMQDLGLNADEAEEKEIGLLLIESPGGKTLEDNGDHFVKRGGVRAMCPHCAAAALYTLHANAPSGGAGHRTSLRGGGPLNTLLVCEPRQSLWQDLWLNVRPRSATLLPEDASRAALFHRFPWCAEQTRTQPGDQTQSAQVHSHQVFWAMPRRIRLDCLQVEAGICALCQRPSDRLLRRYITKNYGLNYKGAWQHPFSPYYESKPGEWLSLHPQPGGLGYRHWLGWVLGMSRADDKKKVRRAAVVGHFQDQQRGRETRASLCLWAFGFDIDKAKARCWYEATVPVFDALQLDKTQVQDMQFQVGGVLAAADLAALALRCAVRDAWFSDDAKGDFSFVDAAFWARTEAAFYNALQSVLAEVRKPDDDRVFLPVMEAWQVTLSRAALYIFDRELVGVSPIERQNPARVKDAHDRLRHSLNSDELRKRLGLPVAVKQKKPKRLAQGA